MALLVLARFFSAALLGYALVKYGKFKERPARGSPLAAIVRGVAVVLVIVCGLVLVATAGKSYLPALFEDRVRGVPAQEWVNYSFVVIITLVCLSAVAVMWRRERSVLDQWLMIVALGVVLEIVIVVLISPRRFDVGFYAGRLVSLLTSSIVMAVLMVETMRLYTNAARSNESKIRCLIDSNIIGILIGNLDGRVREANGAFLQIIGYERADVEAGRLNRTELTPPEWHDRDARAVAELAMTGTVQPFEKEYFRKDGSRVPVLIGGTTFDERGGIVLFIIDLTDRKRVDAESRETERRYREVQLALAHANRIATMGELAASIAHEVNQPVAALLMNAGTAVRWLGRQPPNLDEARQSIGRIVSDGKRVADIVNRIRSFSKKAPAQKDDVEINEAILEMTNLARAAMSDHRVSLKTELSDGLPRILGDKVQLQQVILNLIMNAVEAMSEISERSRKLLISTRAADAGGVLVTVSDSGPGLPQTDAIRIFDAFYTTKASGLGMGLAICRSIVDAHRGRLWATANEPHGAVFRMMLPAQEKLVVN